MSHPHRMLDLRRECLFVTSPNDRFTRFDLEGRWFSAQAGTRSFRRGFDGRVIERVRASHGVRSEILPRRLAPDEAESLAESLHEEAVAARRLIAEGITEIVLRAGMRTDLDELLDRIETWTPARYAADEEKFRAIYGDVPILPADQYLALYLQPVLGCVYNRCRFCSLYHGVPHRVRPPAEWDAHCDAVAGFFGRALPLRHGIFMGDANALDAGADELGARIRSLKERISLPSETLARGFFAFHDTFSGARWQAADYARLAADGLRRVYIGLESGDDTLRRAMAKPGSAADVFDRVRTAKEGGVSVGLMVLVGAGGRAHRDDHIRATLDLIARCGLDRSDIVFLSKLSLASGPDWIDALPSVEESRIEEEAFRKGLPTGTPVSRYELDGFVY